MRIIIDICEGGSCEVQFDDEAKRTFSFCKIEEKLYINTVYNVGDITPRYEERNDNELTIKMKN